MKRKGFKGILLLLSMLFALTGCSVSEATQHGMAVDTIQAEDVLLRVDFLNVGQADCALLSTNGHYMVIDGGNNGDADTILSYLEGQGVEKLDAVVGTHPHEDHIGSLDAIINHFDVDAVYMPKIMHTSKTFEDVLDAVVTRLPETLFLTHHVYPQVLAYQPEDHGDPLTQPVESNGKWLNDQLEAAFWSDDACCEVSRCGSIICRRVAGDA